MAKVESAPVLYDVGQDAKLTAEEIIAQLDSGMVMVYLEPAPRGENNAAFVGFNGVGYLVPRGRPQMVPRPLFYILRQSNDAKDITREFENKLEASLDAAALR